MHHPSSVRVVRGKSGRSIEQLAAAMPASWAWAHAHRRDPIQDTSHAVSWLRAPTPTTDRRPEQLCAWCARAAGVQDGRRIFGTARLRALCAHTREFVVRACMLLLVGSWHRAPAWLGLLEHAMAL
jgi:hypothetical protein